jgi:hypothetical protein
MGYLGSSLAAMVTDRNLWLGRANQAWGASRVWNSSTSFETALGSMTADRNAWQVNANTAYDTGVWGSGTHWSTHYSNMLADRNAWYNQAQAWYTSRYNDGYNAGVAAIANGLNNPDGLQLAGISQNNWNQTSTLTFGRTGHYFVVVCVDLTVQPWQGNSSVTGHLTGISGATKTFYPSNNDNSGGETESGIGWWIALDVDVGAGQTIGVWFDSWVTGMVSATGYIYAHFVPNVSYHN